MYSKTLGGATFLQRSDPNKKQIDILDNIYEKAEHDAFQNLYGTSAFQNKSQTCKSAHRKHHQMKSVFQEQIEKIEENVTRKFYENKVFDQQIKVTDIYNQSLQHQEARSNYEKLKGRFRLRMNPNLPMNKKIETYANEKLTFYLHKNRNFIHKLESTLKEIEVEKKQKAEIEREIKKISQIKQEQRLYRMSKLVNVDMMQIQQLQQLNQSRNNDQQQQDSTVRSHNNFEQTMFDQSLSHDSSYDHNLNTTEFSQENTELSRLTDEEDQVRIHAAIGNQLKIQDDNEQDNILSSNDDILSPTGQPSFEPLMTENYRTESIVKGKIMKNIKSKISEALKNIKGEKYDNQERNNFRVNILYNKLITNSFDTSTQASKTKRVNTSITLQSIPKAMNKTFMIQRQETRNQAVNSLLPVIQDTKRETTDQSIERMDLPVNINTLQKLNTQRRMLNNSESFRQQQSSTKVLSSNMVTFMTKNELKLEQQKQQQKTQVKTEIKTIIDRCLRTRRQAQDNLQELKQSLEEQRFKEQSFDNVFSTLRELEATDSSVIESLYLYKINGKHDFDQEAKQVTREFKLGLLDPTREVSRYEQQMRFKRRKELIKGTIKIKAGR
eukprot:403358083